MGKYNTKNNGMATNHQGGVGYTRTDLKSELISIVVNSLMQKGSFYESEPDRVKHVESLWTQLVLRNDTEFLLKLLVYTRTVMNLRSISHLMGVLAVESIKGYKETRLALKTVMIRPDDATEIVALWNQRHDGVNIPNSLRRAIRDRLENKWDAYALKKYYGTGSVKVSNLIQLTHPNPAKISGKAEMLKQALEGTLPNIDTAQTVNAGTTGDQRAAKYNEMLTEGKLGVMAALKNICNIVEANMDTTSVNMLELLLDDKNRILKSKVLPFRFYQAYQALSDLPGVDMVTKKKLLKAIEHGFIRSAGNIPFAKEDDRVAFMLDDSMSMSQRNICFRNSGLTPFENGKVMMSATMAGTNLDNAIGLLWADRTKVVDITGGPMAFCARTEARGGGTRLHQAVETLITTKTFVDMMVIYTDMQSADISRWGGGKSLDYTIGSYKKINPNVKIVFWNLEGYGGVTPLRIQGNVIEVSGFSEKIIEMIPLLLEDKDALIKRVMNIELK